VAADCAPFAAGDFHARYLEGKAVVCGCPKFDDVEEHVARLTAILQENDIKGVTIVNMEVPCCFRGWWRSVRQALEASGKSLPVNIYTLGTPGPGGAAGQNQGRVRRYHGTDEMPRTGYPLLEA
jgi:hypothetical protein